MTATTPAKPLVIPQLIVGLGNPGSKYERTRHNIGFMVVDALAKNWQISLREERRFQALCGEGWAPSNRKVRLLKPLTYMNNSGQAVRAVIDWFKLPPESVLVIYDDLDLPVGRMRLRLSGSSGGQKGMKSVISHLGTEQFPRLRVGIGSSRDEKTGDRDTISHVLGEFADAEKKLITVVLDQVTAAVELSLAQGVEKAMSYYNGQTATLETL